MVKHDYREERTGKMSEVHSSHVRTASSSDYGYQYTEKNIDNKSNKIMLFGDNSDSRYLQNVLERNGGNVPFGGASFRH